MSFFDTENSLKQAVGFYEYEKMIQNSYTRNKVNNKQTRTINPDLSGSIEFTNEKIPYQKYHKMTSAQLSNEVKNRLRNF